jgi:hypothetical protein
MNTKIFTLGLIAFLGISISSFAQTGKWDQTHPRRAEVNARLNNQDRRIHRERREGEISRGQAVRLHRQDHRIRREERHMAARHNGHITRRDQARLNRQENRTSRRIGH